MKEKGLFDLSNIIIKPLFANEILEYPNLRKLKPLVIDPYDGIKDPIDHLQTFKSHMYNVGTSNIIMCREFLTVFKMAAKDLYGTLKCNSIRSFKEFSQEFISHFASSHKHHKITVNLMAI